VGISSVPPCANIDGRQRESGNPTDMGGFGCEEPGSDRDKCCGCDEHLASFGFGW